MKNDFSTSWISSRQRRKQHKYLHNAPLHVRHKFLSAHLSKDLRIKYSKRNLPLRTGDEVLVMRGSFADKKAKVTSVNVTDSTVTLDGIQRTKKDGTKVNVSFHPSTLQIISLVLDDKQRVAAIERKATPKTAKKESVKPVKAEKTEAKPAKSTKPKSKETKNASN